MKNWKKALRFALCLMPIGLIGGWFAAEMALSSVAPDALETAVQQVGSLAAVKTVTWALLYSNCSDLIGCIRKTLQTLICRA